jgi:Ca2+/Na+ antiporter
MKTAKKIGRYLPLFILLILVLLVVVLVLFRFPKSTSDLEAIKINDTITTTKGDFVVRDIAKTDNASSWYYLLEDGEENQFVIVATQMPYIKRYEMAAPLSMAEGEVFEPQDYYNKITLTVENGSLQLNASRQLAYIMYLFPLLLLVGVIASVLANKDKNKREYV